MSLDFFKAFDTVSQNKLLYKINKYEFSNSMCKWLESFLINRKQCVKLNNVMSSWKSVSSGIAQGSVCGLILYNLYVNDKPHSIEYCKIIMYVGDTRLFIDGSSENANIKMASDLKCLSQWANIWQLKLNVKKCGVMHIGHNNPKFNFVLNNETRQKIYSMKDLGVIIDNTLHFN